MFGTSLKASKAVSHHHAGQFIFCIVLVNRKITTQLGGFPG